MAKPYFVRGSRYRATPFTLVPDTNGNTVETVGVWVKPSWLKKRPNNNQIGNVIITSDLEGRPDKIAQAVYGDDKLDWVIIAFNSPLNPLGWPKTGERVEYPAESIVIPEL